MEFVLSKLFWAVFRPGNVIAIFALAGLVAQIVPSARVRRWGRGLLIMDALAIVVITILPLGAWLLHPLETRFPPPEAPPARIDGLILLGGSFHMRSSEARGTAQLNEHGDRVTAFVALARRYPEAKLVFTGGSARLLRPGATESDVAQVLLRDLGVDVDRVTFERASRNTRENAVNAKQLVQPRAGETWVLVTSAFHMPRAVGVFRRIGWRVVPYPVDYLSDTTSPSLFDFAFTANLGGVTGGLHEWIGLVAYRIFGWTDELFPAPDNGKAGA